jgi:uncharacterized protein
MRRRSISILIALAVLALCRSVAVALDGYPDEPARPRPQEPAGPRPYAELQVTFESAPGVRIAGTLTLPASTPPRAAVVLVGGSGPQDRDAAIAGHRPFFVVADHLARHGVAVLRFDKRGVGESSGDLAAATPLDFANDVIAAVDYLSVHPATRAVQIGVVGHSEGGMVAPLAVNGSPRTAFMVLLAAPGLPLREIGVRQAEAIARAEGVTDAEVTARVELSRSVLALFADHDDAATIALLARPIIARNFARIPLSSHARARQIEIAVQHYASPWAQFALRYDPAPALSAVRVPVLALHGSLDVQIDAPTNLAAIAAALHAGDAARMGSDAARTGSDAARTGSDAALPANGAALTGPAAAGTSGSAVMRRPRVTTRELPRLNHLFQTARTGGLGEYARIRETFSPAALRILSDWILDQAAAVT